MSISIRFVQNDG